MAKKLLMHGNDKVLLFVEDKKGYVESVIDVYDYTLLPFQHTDIKYMQFKLQQWILESRASLNREDINTLYSFYGKDFIFPPNFVSLFNNYWIRNEKDMNTTWELINSYDNWDMNQDVINILVNYPSIIEDNVDIMFNSPNMTLPGTKERYWYKEDDTFYILDKQIRKTKHPIVIYEKQLFSKHKISYISKNYELMPLSFYISSVMDVSLSEYEQLQKTVETYHLDKSKIQIGCLSDVYVVRDAKNLSIVDTITL